MHAVVRPVVLQLFGSNVTASADDHIRELSQGDLLREVLVDLRDEGVAEVRARRLVREPRLTHGARVEAAVRGFNAE